MTRRQARLAGLPLLAALLLLSAVPSPVRASSEQVRESYSQGLEMYRAGRFERAIELLSAGLAGAEGTRDAAAHLTLIGWSRVRLSEPEPARTAFRAAVELDPGSVDPMLGLGFVNLRLNDVEASQRWFILVMELDADNAEAWKGLGLVRLRQGEPVQAVEAFQRSLQANPDDAETRGYLERAEKEVRDSVESRLRPPLDPATPLDLRVRAGKRRFEVRVGDGWRPIFVKGVNLGTALPGRWPAEFPDDPALYREWFEMMGAMGANVLRLYTLHPPSLYKSLREYNAAHPDRKLWLVHGVWTELPPADDFDHPAFVRSFQEETRRILDALHGNLSMPPRPGHAHGLYETDVSEDLLAILLGREWEPFAVVEFDRIHADQTEFEGRFVTVSDATPMERWLAQRVEETVAHMTDHYRHQVPVGWTSWPTLDPLTHPTESTAEEEWAFSGEQTDLTARDGRIYDEDAVGVDATRVHATAAFPAGLYASYHAYPYYPDFMNLDPGYAKVEDGQGVARYLGYLQDLARHHGDQPVLIAEIGVPTSRGIAHLHPEGQHHGGHTTIDQGEVNARLMRNIHQAGLAGGALFAWIDEWFKRNWAVFTRESPAERNRLWLNAMDPEQNFGLIAAWPGEEGWRIVLDGGADDWAEIEPFYGGPSPQPAAAGSRRGKSRLAEMKVTSDEAYLYMMLRWSGPPPRWENGAERLWIGIDTYDAERGDHRLPRPHGGEVEPGLEFLVQVGARGQADSARLLIDPAYRIFSGNSLRPCRSEPNRDGIFSEIIAAPNRARWGRDGTAYPAQRYSRSPLRKGTTDPAADGYDSLADWSRSADGRVLEIRIAWGLLNVADPSSRRVIHEESRTAGLVETRVTDGFRFHVQWFEPRKKAPRILGAFPAREKPGISHYPTFDWPTWERPTFHLVPKRSYHYLKRQLPALN